MWDCSYLEYALGSWLGITSVHTRKKIEGEVMSDLCPVCKKPFHKRRKLMLQGKISNKIGRPKSPKRDDVKIKFLRKEGHSIRTIAFMLGISSASVQRGMK